MSLLSVPPRLLIASLTAALLAGGSPVAQAESPVPTAPRAPSTATTATTATKAATGATTALPQRTATSVYGSMSLAQRVGQLFMVGTPATTVSAATRRQISRFHVGNVMLTGRSYAGTATPARVASAMESQTTDAATKRVRLLVSTDQEGGQVQVLHGSGIDEIPTALRQGTWDVDRLRTASGRWARQLRTAGVNMNLAPVMDTVPSAQAAQTNPPIGAYDREYGYTVTRVARHGTAFMRGMAANKVVPTIKHFPGLGRVHANTDTSVGVTDTVTRRGDAYLRPFQTAIGAGAPVVMMSTAYYSRMDAHNPAAFSAFIIGKVLRGDLDFTGVVISDDLANARQVSPWRPGTRAVKFIGAGGDLVLSVTPDPLPSMYQAVLDRARSNATFKAKVNRAALRVLRLKGRQGLLGG